MHRTQRTLLLTIGMVIAALALGSCRKVQNPMPSDLKRSGFLLNYGFKNPEAKRQILTPPIAKEFEEGHLTLLICQDLIPRSVLDSYTRLSGVKVSIVPCLETTDLHEHANSGELADLLITDSYMIHVLRDGNRLEKLDYNAIPNAAHLNPEFRELAFDPDNQYSLPLTWSTLGIAYNSRVLDETPKTWQDLFDPVDPDRSEAAGKIGLLASPHRLFSAALVHLGYSPNSLNPSEGQAAADFLISSVAKTQFHLVSPLNIISELESGKLRLAMAHSAEAARAAARNPRDLLRCAQ